MAVVAVAPSTTKKLMKKRIAFIYLPSLDDMLRIFPLDRVDALSDIAEISQAPREGHDI